MSDNNYEPDDHEKAVRFGCGALFGVFLVTLGALKGLSLFFDSVWITGAMVAAICGFLALKYGDAFWHFIAGWFSHWRR